MNEFLDIPNPENKINGVLDIAIENRENKVKKIEQEIESVKKQKGSGVYYIEMTNIDANGAPIKNIGMTLISIVGDILSGFSDAAKKLKQQADAVQGDSNAKDISEQADKLDKIVGKVQEKTNKLVETVGGLQKGGVLSETTDNNTSSLGNRNENEQVTNASSTESLIDSAKSMGSETASQLKDIGIASVKTGIKWSGDFINDMIEMGMEMTGEANILDTPIDELSPELNKNILLLAGLLKEVSENPATREAVKGGAQAVAISIIEILDETRSK